MHSQAEHLLIGEQRRTPASVDEDDVVAGLPAARADQGDQAPPSPSRPDQAARNRIWYRYKGTIVSQWRTTGARVLYEVVVPSNSTARLPVLPRPLRRDGRRLPATGETTARVVLEAGTHRAAFFP